MSLDRVLEKTRAEFEARRRRRMADSEAFSKKSREDEEYVMRHLRSATLEEFKVWLEAFVAKNRGSGGVDWIPMPFSRCRVHVATKSFRMRPMNGAAMVQIIVPGKFKVDGPVGHSLLMLESGELKGDSVHHIFVPREL